MHDSKQKIKTAIVGFGLSSTVFHIPFIQCSSQFELVAISSHQREKILAQIPTVSIFSNAQQMIEESDAELIIITSPNSSHYSLAQHSLKNNKHVIVEKPFVTKTEHGEQLIQLAQSQQRILAPFHNRRWDGDFLTAKELIHSGQLGELKYFESHFDRFRPTVRQRWREQPGDGAGILYDLGPHLIDQAVNLFGMPLAITAQNLMTRKHSEATDFFNIWLHYSDMNAVLQSSPFSAGPLVRFHIQGTQGSYIKYGLDPQEERLRKGITPTQEDWSAESPENYGVLYLDTENRTVPTCIGGYQHFFYNIANAIWGKETLIVTPEEALSSIQIIELAIQSSRQKKTLYFK